jgi:hypothetical protein
LAVVVVGDSKRRPTTARDQKHTQRGW